VQKGGTVMERDRSNGPRNHVTPDDVIRRLASRQHGVVGRHQLAAAGVPFHVIDYRVRTGELHCLYRGVYRVGPITAPYGRHMAAVLACGGTAVVSHASAAELLRLPLERSTHPVEVYVLRGYRAPSAELRVHRVLRKPESTRVEGIPVTTVGRTLLDLAGCCTERAAEQALAHALRQRLVSTSALRRLLERHPTRRGARLLRALLLAAGGPALTRSQAEELLLALVRRGGLPPPEVNARIAGMEVDFLWRAARLVVEVDGYAYHSSARAFEQDRKRDATLLGLGYRVLRVTWRQLRDEPDAVLVRLIQLLAPAAVR
jgi:very-short-patch-repair endonuclease/predicted transcriptional regulator of viral defense system